MELQSFSIGIVTMIVFAIAIITVLGILKVTELTKNVLTLKRRLEDDERELNREINQVEQNLVTHINHVEDAMHRALENAERADKSYTDHRIDKLIDTYLIPTSAKKQVLKD